MVAIVVSALVDLGLEVVATVVKEFSTSSMPIISVVVVSEVIASIVVASIVLATVMAASGLGA